MARRHKGQGAHLVLGIDVSTLLHEKLGRSQLIVAHRKVPRSRPVCANGVLRIGGGAMAERA